MPLSISHHGFPPGPTDVLDLDSESDPLARMCALHREYGDIYRIRLPRKKHDSYVVCHPEDIKNVLIENRGAYKKGPGFDRVRMLLGNGIICSDGEFWKRHRLMIQPAFHRDMVAIYAERVREICRAWCNNWLAAADTDHSVDVTQDTSVFALESVLRALFSEDVDTHNMLAADSAFLLLTEESKRDLDFARRFRTLTTSIRDLAEARRASRHEYVDVLSLLLDSRDRYSGERMSDKQLVDEVMTLIVAGHETTASTLNWTWYLLSRNPDVERTVWEEVDRQPYGSVPSVADLSQLVYCRQVLEEALRLYPPVWRFTRTALVAGRIGGYVVPPGTDLFICPYITHRHADFWPEPERFSPERFASQASANRHRLAFIPFSAGPRRCIGDTLALLEMQLHLSTIARTLRLRRASDSPVEMEAEINLRSRGSILMRPERRRAA